MALTNAGTRGAGHYAQRELPPRAVLQAQQAKTDENKRPRTMRGGHKEKKLYFRSKNGQAPNCYITNPTPIQGN